MNTETIIEKFTPGPWAVQPMHQILWIGTPKDGGQLDELILHINQDESYKDEKKERNIANARLIAAAPEMYEALKNIVAHEEDAGLFDRIAGDNASGHDLDQSKELGELISKIKLLLKKATE